MMLWALARSSKVHKRTIWVPSFGEVACCLSGWWHGIATLVCSGGWVGWHGNGGVWCGLQWLGGFLSAEKGCGGLWTFWQLSLLPHFQAIIIGMHCWHATLWGGSRVGGGVWHAGLFIIHHLVLTAMWHLLSLSEEGGGGIGLAYLGWHRTWTVHFSHPFLGTYEVVQFLELGNLKGTHPGVVYELHINPMVSWDANPIPYPSLSNTKSPHTIPFGS